MKKSELAEINDPTEKQKEILNEFFQLLHEQAKTRTDAQLAGAAFDIGYERGYAVGYNKGLKDAES